MTERLFDRLPPEGRATIETIAFNSRTLLGAQHTIQTIVQKSIREFEQLLAGGISPGELCTILAERGVAGKGGAPIPKPSLTSALCRARKTRTPGKPAAANCDPLQRAAIGCNRLHSAAAGCDSPKEAATRSGNPQTAAASSIPLQIPAPQSKGKGVVRPEGGRGPPVRSQESERMSLMRRRGQALNAIRSEHTHDQE